MKKLLFKKLSGAGNDFILIDRKENENIELNPELVSEICNRRTGIGADGVLEIDDTEGRDFLLTYYNSDGYPGSLCGNGSRCAIKYADYSGRLKSSKVKFLCDNTEYSGEVLSSKQIKFFLNQPTNLKKDIQLVIDEIKFNGDFIDTGSAHFVCELKCSVDDFNNYNVIYFGEKLRNHQQFSPAGTNVNFVKVQEEEVLIRTFERGVEDETLACGTGSVASALLLFLNKKVEPPVTLKVRSEEKLIVNFEYDKNVFTNISLTGPAEILFAGEYYIT